MNGMLINTMSQEILVLVSLFASSDIPVTPPSRNPLEIRKPLRPMVAEAIPNKMKKVFF